MVQIAHFHYQFKMDLGAFLFSPLQLFKQKAYFSLTMIMMHTLVLDITHMIKGMFY